MTVTTITLTDPDQGISTVLKPRDGIAYQGMQVTGVPRAVTESRTGGDGMLDSTSALDDAAVTLSLSLYSTPGALMDEIGQYLHPSRRPLLIVGDTEWAQDRQLMLRTDSPSTPRELGKGLRRDLAYSWRAPNGIWEQAGDLAQFTVPVTLPATDGVHVDAAAGLHVATDGLHMKSTGSVGEYVADNPGTEPVQWTGFLYGPASSLKLANDTAGYTLAFTEDVALGVGDYVQIDSTGQALLNGDPSSSVLSNLDYSVDGFGWWLMQGGQNLLRYFPDNASAGAEAVIFCRPGWYPQ